MLSGNASLQCLGPLPRSGRAQGLAPHRPHKGPIQLDVVDGEFEKDPTALINGFKQSLHHSVAAS